METLLLASAIVTICVISVIESHLSNRKIEELKGVVKEKNDEYNTTKKENDRLEDELEEKKGELNEAIAKLKDVEKSKNASQAKTSYYKKKSLVYEIIAMQVPLTKGAKISLVKILNSHSIEVLKRELLRKEKLAKNKK